MYCQNCGSKISDDSKFCTSCGASIAKINSITTDKNRNTKCLGSAFIISGLINAFFSAVFACIPPNMEVNGLAIYNNQQQNRLLDIVYSCGNIHIGLVVAEIVLLVFGIILTIINKTLVTILSLIALLIINVLLLMPYIKYQIVYA